MIDCDSLPISSAYRKLTTNGYFRRIANSKTGFNSTNDGVRFSNADCFFTSQKLVPSLKYCPLFQLRKIPKRYPITSETPQGLILRPLLFQIRNNDVPAVFIEDLTLCADDCNLKESQGGNLRDSCPYVDLRIVHQQPEDNGFKVNYSKTVWREDRRAPCVWSEAILR